MKAILIDPYLQLISYVDIPKKDHLKEIYKVLKCSTITAPVTFENNDTLYADDEYWLRGHDMIAGFMLPDWTYPICGYCLVIGCDDEGDDTDVKTDVEDLLKSVKWYDHRKLLEMYG